MRFEPAGATNNPRVRFAKSIPDYVARWMALEFLTEDDRRAIGLEGMPGCPVARNQAMARLGAGIDARGDIAYACEFDLLLREVDPRNGDCCAASGASKSAVDALQESPRRKVGMEAKNADGLHRGDIRLQPMTQAVG